ncbi:hypothetical protein [Actinoplanes teichomyceticus]|uniref:Uncharacterized protein n=1 Tax=Actinoplanes teichomyceticus TaxID=1867 RepID=A0A561VGQ7_ACTTI|nr:hypothetical protein [Actinoplanes teichomyceticus]TWG10806.1 hypothetical protein FHX34_107303 [Actinoplanes teichomyceticus]GIF12573.1 hypothetical protein Ate01nite_26050 [Actinoplanes teichomyceticus]
MGADAIDPAELGDPVFLAARSRALARDGVLAGRYVLVDGELLKQAYAAWDPDGVAVVVRPDHPGAHQEKSGRWIGRVPHERIALTVLFTTTARHSGGGLLELQARDGGTVRATWWYGDNPEPTQAIPDGFLWEKNDDYYYGTVRWAELRDVTISARLLPRHV